MAEIRCRSLEVGSQNAEVGKLQFQNAEYGFKREKVAEIIK